MIDGNTVDTCIWNGGGGASIEVTGSDEPNTCTNVTVSNNVVLKSGFEGIGMYKYVTNSSIIGNIIYDGRQPHVYVDGSESIAIQNNIVYRSASDEYAPAQAIAIGNEDILSYCFISNYIISGNYVANMSYGLTLSGQTNCYLNNANVYDNIFADNTYNIMLWPPTTGWTGNNIYHNISYTSNNSAMYHSNDYSPSGFTWGANIFDDAVSGNAAVEACTVAAPLSKTTGWDNLTAGAVTASDFDLSSAGLAGRTACFGGDTTPPAAPSGLSVD
jgi:hypothetical protein